MTKINKVPMISIIIPVFNVEKYLKKSLDSIINQTYKNFEIILINDGSTDDSLKICNEYLKVDSRISLINQNNAGAAAARNCGIRKATGDYLFFVDSDDYINEKCLEFLVEKIDEFDSDYITCDYYKCYEDNKSIEYINLFPNEIKEGFNKHILAMPGPVCKLIKRSLFKNNATFFPEGIIFEDNAIMPFIASLSSNPKHVNKALYYYLQREGSSLNQKNYNKSFEDIFKSLEILYNLFKNNNTLEKYNSELEYIYIEYLIHAAGLKLSSYNEGKKFIPKIKKIMLEKFPDWRKNQYYKMHNFKYKIVCNLLYFNKINLLNLLLKRK